MTPQRHLGNLLQKYRCVGQDPVHGRVLSMVGAFPFASWRVVPIPARPTALPSTTPTLSMRSSAATVSRSAARRNGDPDCTHPLRQRMRIP